MQSPRRFSVSDLVQFAGAYLSLAAASLAIRLLPFRGLVGTMGWWGAAKGRPEGKADAAVTEVRRAAARMPWRTVCFDRGLAAHWLMRCQGVPSTLHYGINPGDEELSAHVWVSFKGRILIGEEEAGYDTKAASFPKRPGGQTR